MDLQDVVDRAELIDAVLDQGDRLIHLLTGRRDLIVTRRLRSRAFNAEVGTADGRSYTVLLHDGLVDRLRSALTRLESEALDDQMRATAEELLGDPDRVDICHRIWLVQSLLFVLLHEVAHVVCGHLGWWRLAAAPGQEAAFRYTEVDGPPLPEPAAPGDTRRLRWLMELEADEVALDRMLVLAHELFFADEEAARLHPEPGPDLDAVPEAERRAAEALTFYAACTAMALIEAQQSRTQDHPPAMARLHHLVNTFVRRLLTGNEGPDGVVRLALTPERRRVLGDVVAPLLVDAMDIVASCCEAAGVSAEHRYGGPRGSVARRLAADLAGLLTDRPVETLSDEARIYRDLRGDFPSLHRHTEAHRLPGG